MGAIQFVENLDRTSLTVSDEEFETNVEAAVSIIAEKHREEMPPPPPPPRPSRSPNHPHISEKSGLSQPEVIRRNSLEVEYSTSRKATSLQDGADDVLRHDGSEGSTAVGGLLRTIKRPLSSLGKMFTDETPNVPPSGPQEYFGPSRSPPRLSPAVFQPPRRRDEAISSSEESRISSTMNDGQANKANAEDAAARQAVAEAAEAQRIQKAEHRNVVELVFFKSFCGLWYANQALEHWLACFRI